MESKLHALNDGYEELKEKSGQENKGSDQFLWEKIIGHVREDKYTHHINMRSTTTKISSCV